MTCVLSSSGPWNNHFNELPWLPMNSDSKSSQLPAEEPFSQRYASPGSDTRKSSTSSGKKRASRAGTRSVSTLSAAQLERKRANDREAQRAIRQRTKDHIDHLERSITELRDHHDANEKIVTAARLRARELEDENSFLRSKLGEAGYNVAMLTTEHHRTSEPTLLTLPSTSPAHSSSPDMQRIGSGPAPNIHSINPQSSASRQGSWQHPAAGFMGAPNTPITLPSAAAVSTAPTLTTWRSHENMQSNPALGSNLQDSIQATPGSFHQDQRVEWQVSPTSYQPYVTQDPSRSEQYETTPSQQQQHTFQPPNVQNYGASPSPQSTSYHSITSPNEFSGMAVSSSPSTYHASNHGSFPQATTFQVTPIQIPSSGDEYTSPAGQMQPPPLPSSSFHPSRGEQVYGTSQAQNPMQYRDDGTSRSYSLTQFGTA